MQIDDTTEFLAVFEPTRVTSLLSVEILDDALYIQEGGNFSQDVCVCYPFTGIIESRGVDERYTATASFKVVVEPDLGCHRLDAMSNLNILVAGDQCDELPFNIGGESQE